MPTWLRELQREVADESTSSPGGASSPDWLADLAPPAAPPERAPAAPGDAGGASWLDSLGADQPPPRPEASPAGQDDEQPSTNSRIKMPVGATDWLRSMGHDPDARSEPISEPVSPQEESSGVPDWLRDLSDDDLARAIEADAPDSQPRFDPQAPGWLTDDQPTPDASTVSANWMARGSGEKTADQVPDWLHDEAEADAGEAQQRRRDEPPPSDLAGGAEVPAWLRELGADEGPGVEDQALADDEPAWLRDAAARPPTDRFGAAEEVEVPAWLSDVDEPAPAEPAAWPTAADVSAPAATGADDLPSWLRESEAAPAAAAPAGREGPAGGSDGDEVPAWLRESEAAPPAPAATGADDLPSWLRESEAPPALAPARREEPPAGVDGDEVPAWLREAEGAGAAGHAEPPAGVDGDEVPAWLREAEGEQPPAVPEQGPDWLRGEGAAALGAYLLHEAMDGPGEPARSDANVPEWLQDEAAEPPPQPPPAGLPAAAAASALPAWLLAEDAPVSDAPAGAPADPGLPSWLRGVTDEAPAPAAPGGPPPDQPRRQVPAAEQSESNSFLSGAELPSWLRVPEPERPGDAGEGQALDWLRRLGGSDQEDEPQLAGVAAGAIPQRAQYQRTAEQVASIELLKRISRMPYPEPALPVAPAPLTRWQRIGLDRVLYALLAVALLAALLAPILTTPLQTTAPSAPGAAELGALLDGLDSEDVVLVAYEWGAQRSSELRPLEMALASRLIANKTKLILVSTDLQGTLLSFDIVEPLRAAGYNNEQGVNFGGRDYVLLGYRPGGELALRSLVQDLRDELSSDFDGQDATQSLVANNADGTPRFTGINDLSMILVMADQPQDVQAWMEQVHPAARDVPIAFLLPQDAQPLVQPYLRMPNVYHLAGQQGALALAAGATAGDPAAVARSTGQLWYAVAVFLVLLAVGAVSAAFSRGRAARGGAA